MRTDNNFTQGPILGPLLRFALPVLAALFLQTMYGAVDMLIVARFAAPRDVSAVSTGSMIMHTLTCLVSSLAVSITILIGQLIGEGDRERAGDVMGTAIVLFLAIGAAMTLLIQLFAIPMSAWMNAPEEAFVDTVIYIRICGGGAVVIIAYNLIGSIFRGLGDSRTPLITVAIACAVNIAGDLLLVAVFGMGTAGAAIATVAAQAISVWLSVAMIRRRELPFTFHRGKLRPVRRLITRILSLGTPIALQELLVSISFMVILAIVNDLGLMESAGVGVAERICGLIMLVPSAFSQSMAAFTAQNIGAGQYLRARKALVCAVSISTFFGFVMFVVNFWFGDRVSAVFAADPQVILASAEYLKAYAIDCMLTCFLFCLIGFFNGLGMTRLVMVQGILGALCVRVPAAYFFSRMEPVSLFRIGLATPMSSALQITILSLSLLYANRRFRGYDRNHQEKVFAEIQK